MRSPLSSRRNNRPAARSLRSELAFGFVAISSDTSFSVASELRLRRIVCELRRPLLCVRYGTAGTQRIDLSRAETELCKEFLGVLPDFRSAFCSHLGDAAHLDRTTDRRSQLAAGPFKRNDNVVQPQLR